MKRTLYAQAAGATAPTNDEGPAVAAAAPQESKRSEKLDFQPARPSGQALRSIEGEEKAVRYLAQLHGGIAEPGELAVIIAFLNSEMLHGACRLIERALGVRHA